MFSLWKSGKVFVLSAVMFSAGASAATIALSYLPIVTAAPGIVAGAVKQSKGETVIEQDNFKFELQRCQRGGQGVTCQFLIANIGDADRKLELMGDSNAGNKSRIFDFSGNEYGAKSSQLGESANKIAAGTTLIRGIPVKGSIQFELPQQITRLAVLEVGYNWGAKL